METAKGLCNATKIYKRETEVFERRPFVGVKGKCEIKTERCFYLEWSEVECSHVTKNSQSTANIRYKIINEM